MTKRQKLEEAIETLVTIEEEVNYLYSNGKEYGLNAKEMKRLDTISGKLNNLVWQVIDRTAVKTNGND